MSRRENEIDGCGCFILLMILLFFIYKLCELFACAFGHCQ